MMAAFRGTPDTHEATARLAGAVPAVRLERLVKRFGDDKVGRRVATLVDHDGTFPVTAVNGIDLDVRDGEFFSMLGPSGSGNTTTLRMIAGFELVNVVALVLIVISVLPVWLAQRISGGETAGIGR